MTGGSKAAAVLAVTVARKRLDETLKSIEANRWPLMARTLAGIVETLEIILADGGAS
jgi:hypothetical protein